MIQPFEVRRLRMIISKFPVSKSSEVTHGSYKPADQSHESHDIAKDTPLRMEYPNSSDHNRGCINVIMTENHEEGGGYP